MPFAVSASQHGTIREYALLVSATSEAAPDDLPGAYSDRVSIEDLRALQR